MIIELDVQSREGSAPDALRAQGFLPAVVYGRKEATQPLSIDARAFERVWREAGETTIVSLKGLGHEVETLIHEVQVHPVSGVPLHADFYALEKGKKVTIAVPLEFVGEAPAEKQGHVFVKALHEIEIEVAPAELPHALEVDVSSLVEIGDHITAGEIRLPPSATLQIDPEEVIASITGYVEEPVEEPKTEAPAAEGAAEATTPAAEAPAEEK